MRPELFPELKELVEPHPSGPSGQAHCLANGVEMRAGENPPVVQRRRAEARLRESERRLAHAMRLAQLVAWEYDVATGLFTFSDRYYALHGTTAKLENGNQMSAEDYARKYMHPDDAHLVADEIGKAMATADPDYHSQLENRILRRDGEIRHVLTYISITKDAAGRTVQLQGANQDITARKKADEDLRKLWRAVEQSPAAVVIANAGGDIEYVNPKFVAITGYSVAEAIGQNPRLLKSGLHSTDFYKAIWDTILRGDVWKGEICNKKKNGELYWESASISPIHDPKGKITHFIAVKEDITECKLAEVELQASERKFQVLFESSSDAIMTLEPPSWRFTSGNPAAVKMFGAKSEKDLIPHCSWELSPDRQVDGRASAEKARDMIETAMREGSHGFEWTHRRFSGEMFPTIVRLSRAQSAEKVFLQATVRDITEEKRLYYQLLEASRMAGMAAVATSVLHNVGNVLNSVNISTSIISDKIRQARIANLGKAVALLREHESDLAAYLTQDAKGKQLLGYLHKLAGHLAAEQAEVVEELASLTKNVDHIKEIVAMQQNYAKVSCISEIVLPADLIEDALRINGASLERHQIEVVREYSKTPAMVVDKHKVLQILVNLVRNAKHACDESRRPDKRLTARVGLRGNNRVAISIVDNGIGIAAENLPRIFNHGFTTRRYGHGFGLHNSALSAQELGGALTARSGGVGQGAEFTLDLPLQPSQETPPKTRRPHRPWLRACPRPHGNGRLVVSVHCKTNTQFGMCQRAGILRGIVSPGLIL